MPTRPRPPRAFKHTDIRLGVALRAAPERIWAALSSARELCAWWLERAETDARNGGRFRFVWPVGAPGPAEGRGVFVDLEPGRKLAWLWHSGGRPRSAPPLSSFFLEPTPRGCRVTLLHAGFPTSAKALLRDYRGLWEDCLAKLALYLESGRTCKEQKLGLAELEALRRGLPKNGRA